MRYPAHFAPASEGGFVVTFRDIPEAITQGETEAEAMEMAEDALLTAMDFYFEDKRPVPPPSALLPEERLVELPLGTWAKVLLLNEMLAQKVSASELARRMGTSPQNVNRLTSINQLTKIDTVEKAMRAVGKRLELSAH